MSGLENGAKCDSRGNSAITGVSRKEKGGGGEKENIKKVWSGSSIHKDLPREIEGRLSMCEREGRGQTSLREMGICRERSNCAERRYKAKAGSWDAAVVLRPRRINRGQTIVMIASSVEDTVQ